MHWTQFSDLAESTGFIFLAVLLLWTLMGFIIYWAIAVGATSMGEGAKYRMIEDDAPIPQGGGKYGRH